jgi:hypothetical protein
VLRVEPTGLVAAEKEDREGEEGWRYVPIGEPGLLETKGLERVGSHVPPTFFSTERRLAGR